jgi:hypothetical protein
MSPSEEKDPLDVLLREQSKYVNDDGFTGHVIARLPRRRRTWLRPALLLGVTAIGSALAVRWLPWETLPPLDASTLLSLNSQVLWPWLSVLLVAGSLVWAVVAAVQWDD